MKFSVGIYTAPTINWNTDTPYRAMASAGKFSSPGYDITQDASLFRSSLAYFVYMQHDFNQATIFVTIKKKKKSFFKANFVEPLQFETSGWT